MSAPYTRRSIKRAQCVRCGERASDAFTICAAGTHRQLPVCKECDIAINAMIVRFLGFPDAEQMIETYARKRRRPLSGMAARIAAVSLDTP
jgi:NAD-dependent SIR2 family protein deacetylase